MRDDGYKSYRTVRVDMRERMIARMVSDPEYRAAIPITAADLRGEGDGEGAAELESMAAEAQRRVDAVERAPSRTRVAPSEATPLWPAR